MKSTRGENTRPGAWKHYLVRKLAESSFLTTSLLFHVILITLLGGIVLFKAAVNERGFDVGQQGFLQDTYSEELPNDAGTEPAAEFDEPAAATASMEPVAQSAISALTDAQSTWNTTSSMDRVSVGTTLSGSTSYLPPAANPSTAPGSLSPGAPSSFTFMGIRSESRRVVFLLDASGSMILEAKGGGKAFAELKEELITLVDNLDSGTEFNVIMFGSGAVDVFKPEAVSASHKNVADLRQWLAPYLRDKAGILRQTYSKSPFGEAAGSTRLDIGLMAAFEMQADTLFILTDGTPSISRLADEVEIKKWEKNREKNKKVFAEYEKAVEDYKVKFKEEFEQAKKKANSLNSNVNGRTQESYGWVPFAPNFPKPPPDYQKPRVRVDAREFNEVLKRMAKECYVQKNSPAPSINVIGYYVEKDAEEYLAAMTKGFTGKYRNFRK